jgi:hypothetical protein
VTPDETLAEFKIRLSPAETRVTGFVGLVIQPDAATIRASYELAASLMPTSPEAVALGSLPHLTLTHCALRDAPRTRLAEYVDRLDTQLAGRRVPLGAVVGFGAGFVFWCADPPTSPERAGLQRAHEYAITVADGFLDPVVNAAVVEGTRRVTNDDPALVGNARAFGYAFARDRYLPHITLGFDPRPVVDTPPHVHSMSVKRVVLAKLGPRGRVECVLSL